MRHAAVAAGLLGALALGRAARAADNPLRLVAEWHVAGDVAVAATCIRHADPADGGPTGGVLRLRGIPPSAEIEAAWLYWTELSPETPIDPGTPTMDGIALGVVPIAEIDDSPCFSEAPRTGSFRADVTSLVTGDGDHVLADFPFRGGGDPSQDSIFVEGATLLVVFCGGDGLARHVLLWDGIDITNIGRPTFRQDLTGFVAPAVAPFPATLVAVAGNGQSRDPADDPDPFVFDGVDLDALDPSILSGSLCPPDGLYDLTVRDVSTLVAPGSTSARLEITCVGDCHSIAAVALSIAEDSGSTAIAEPSALDRRPTAEPLRVTKSPGGLRISWEDVGATTYDVLRGAIGDWYSHGPLACDVATPMVVTPLESNNSYYLAVSVGCGGAESSRGRDSFGRERPTALDASGSSCR